MGLVCGVGINDMPRGWSYGGGNLQSLNHRIYQVWHSMLSRCYDEKCLIRKPTYKGCAVCERWKILSNFVNDIKNIVGYDEWANNPNERIMLDKDTVIPGNKIYSPENCCFISSNESQRDVSKRCHDRLYNEKTNNARRQGRIKKVICIFDDGREETFNSISEIESKYGFNHSSISAVCNGRRNHHHGCKFRYA